MLLLDLVERPKRERIDFDAHTLAVLRDLGLVDVGLGALAVEVTTRGDRIAEAIHVLWLHARSGDAENGCTRALRALVAEVAGAMPAEPVSAPSSTEPTSKAKRKTRR